MMEIGNYLNIATQEQLCAEYEKPDRMIIGGGTNLLVKGRLKNCYQNMTFLPTAPIESLRRIELSENRIVIGAAVTLSEILKDTRIKEKLPLLFQAVSRIGSCQIRNRATLAGNIANACPAADGIQALLVLDAQLEISSCSGTRHMGIMDLYKECAACLKHEGMQVSSCYYTNPCEKKLILNRGEWISRIIIHTQQNDEKSYFYKLTDNQSSNLAIVNLAMTTRKTGSGPVYVVKVSIGGMFPKPKLFVWQGSASEIQSRYKPCLEKEMDSVEGLLIDFWYKKQVVLEKIKELLEEL